MSKTGKLYKTLWGDLEGVAPLAIPEFHHVHTCNAAAEDRDCHFDWRKHNQINTKGECQCFPEIDISARPEMTGISLIFIVHRGGC